MNIEVSKDLIKLAKVFEKNGARLYIVGGFVRNAILGFCETDIDICSNLLPSQIENMLDKKKFIVKLINPKLGTVHIGVKGENIEYEHTTFRAEVYAKGGAHSPNDVRFVNDMSLDASRRDFTANAIYYDILSGEVVDYYNGVLDVKNHILRTVETPQYVFSRDGLRILRMVRIANELDFDIDKNTFLVAKKLSKQLDDISQERFNKEIVSILFADFKYDAIDNPKSYLKGISQIGELNAWQYVLPEFYKQVGGNIKVLYNNDWINLLKSAQPALRISAFLIDIFDALEILPTKQLVFSILGSGGIMLNKRECERQFTILDAFYQVKNGQVENINYAKKFLQKYNKILVELLSLCGLANISGFLYKTYKLMKLDKVPFSLKDLDINGFDILNTYPEIKKQNYSKILNTLLQECAIMPELNEKQVLLDLVNKLNKNN